MPVVMYQRSLSVFWKNAAVWREARVSDQMGTDSRRGVPRASTGITARLWPEMARHSIRSAGTRRLASSARVLSTTAFHQSEGRCSCHPVSG